MSANATRVFSNQWTDEVTELPNFKVLSKSVVDNEQWYTVRCRRETSQWIRETFKDQEDQQWFQNIDEDERWYINLNVFDVNEKIYTVIALRWT